MSTAVAALGTLDLTNAGTIQGGASFAANGETLAGAIQSFGDNDRVINTGTIIGSIATGAGDDRIENYGTLNGDVFLGAGDDTFLHRVSATLTGTVDGGAGTDSLIIDAAGGGTVRGSQFVNFERFSQTGSGAVNYVGAFQATTLDISGGTLNVGAGETLSSIGPVTITGSDAAETIDNAGTIAGSVAMGAGDDIFIDRAGSSVAGGVDGGTGVDLYRVILSGNRSGISARSGFEQLAVNGNGTLALTLEQRFDSVALAGTGLALTLNGNTVGTVTGSDAAEMLSVDGDITRVALGGGNDMLMLGTVTANGTYAGETGSDTLRFTSNAPVTLAGNASRFETITLAGNRLDIAGTLGATGNVMTLGEDAVALASGGTINGALDLGAGNDSFSLAPGAMLNGTVAGGAGDDLATVTLAGARTLDAATLTGFETLASTGTGTLTLTGAQNYGQVTAGTDLTIASGASLTTGTVRLASGNERLTIAGGFAGAVDGGAGSDTITISGGSAGTPVAFTGVSNVEAFGMTGGYATVSGNAALGNAALTGGRLVGLANSTIAASRIDVGAGATFGSAGTVNGNVNVAGTLSPGASPGIMTVNGNVALGGGSLSVFELTPTVSDKLVVNGALSIVSGATLQIVPVGTLRAGSSYDLITASGGLTGAFTTVNKPKPVRRDRPAHRPHPAARPVPDRCALLAADGAQHRLCQRHAGGAAGDQHAVRQPAGAGRNVGGIECARLRAADAGSLCLSDPAGRRSCTVADPGRARQRLHDRPAGCGGLHLRADDRPVAHAAGRCRTGQQCRARAKLWLPGRRRLWRPQLDDRGVCRLSERPAADRRAGRAHARRWRGGGHPWPLRRGQRMGLQRLAALRWRHSGYGALLADRA